jgi:hypothetical protein
MDGDKLITVVIWGTIIVIVYEAVSKVIGTAALSSIPNVNGLLPATSGPLQTSTTALSPAQLQADASQLASSFGLASGIDLSSAGTAASVIPGGDVDEGVGAFGLGDEGF